MKIIAYTFAVICLFQQKTLSQNTIRVISDKSHIDLTEEIPLRSQFLDSVFCPGKVHFKNGSVSNALMNYSLLSNGIAFVNPERRILILEGLNEILLVKYGKRVFVPYNGSLLEQVETFNSNTSLYIKRKTTYEREAKGPYGMKLEITNSDQISTYDDYLTQIQHDIKNETTINVTLKTEYFLKVNGKMSAISRVKDLKRVFPARKDAIADYIAQNNLNIRSLDDLKALIRFCLY